jgi:hypothetical protein
MNNRWLIAWQGALLATLAAVSPSTAAQGDLTVLPKKICVLHDNGLINCTTIQEIISKFYNERIIDVLIDASHKLHDSNVDLSTSVPLRCANRAWQIFKTSGSPKQDRVTMMQICQSANEATIASGGGLPPRLNQIDTAIASCRQRGSGARIVDRFDPRGVMTDPA